METGVSLPTSQVKKQELREETAQGHQVVRQWSQREGLVVTCGLGHLVCAGQGCCCKACMFYPPSVVHGISHIKKNKKKWVKYILMKYFNPVHQNVTKICDMHPISVARWLASS